MLQGESAIVEGPALPVEKKGVLFKSGPSALKMPEYKDFSTESGLNNPV